MSSVSKEQRQSVADSDAFAASVFNGRPLGYGDFEVSSSEARIYRRNVELMARNALAVTYPTVHGLLGPWNFGHIARSLLDSNPPDTGDWGEWGRRLPGLLCRDRSAAEFPFLVPAARLDWRIHRTTRLADTPPREDTLKLLETEDLADLTIDLAEHCTLLSSRYPLIEIREWQSTQQGDASSFTVSKAPRRLLIYRPQYKVELGYLSEADYQFFLGLKQARPLASLLEELLPQGFDLSRWIAFAVQNQLIHQFRTLN